MDDRLNAKLFITTFERPREHGAPIDLVVEALADNGYDEEDATHEIDRLRRIGEIYEPVSGFLKVV